MDQASSTLTSKIKQIVEYSPKKSDNKSRDKIKSKQEQLICTESQNKFCKYEGSVVISLLACVNHILRISTEREKQRKILYYCP